jgi:TolA-binding protein
LRRYDQSLEAYGAALADIGTTIGHRLVNPEVIRASLTVVSDRLRREGDLLTALEYMRLAVRLISPDDLALYSQYLERLGDLLAATGHQRLEESKQLAAGDDIDAMRQRLVAEAELLFNEAGETYFEMSSVNTLNEERAATAMWTAAGLFDQAGNDDRAIVVLETYLQQRPESTLVPRVLLRLGRTLQKVGRYSDAVEAYQRNYSEYPRSIHANESLIPLAESLMALGGDFERQAEKALLEVVSDSDIYTPDAPEYRDAMFLLGRFYSRRADFERSIGVLGEFVQRYPVDPRIESAMFLVADAYRQSAQSIKNELLDPQFAGQAKRLVAEREQRLNQAAARFRTVIERFEARDTATLSPLEQVYLQDAVFGEAASLFDLGRYKEALGLYERAAWSYKDQPAALGAYVQIINCHVILGREAEALAALRRAQYLTEAIADESFQPATDLETRADWKRYFDWVAGVLGAGVDTEPALGSTS